MVRPLVFSSLFFLYCFLPASILLYVISPTLRIKNWLLTILSLIFYAWGEPICVLLLLVQTLLGYIGGLCAESLPSVGKKLTVGLTSALILAMLAVFKYADFILINVNSALNLSIPLLGLSLPIGISFFTFQTLSYVIDVSRGRAKAQRFFPDLLLYVSLFPQLIAGPILRYTDVDAQLQDRKTTPEGVFNGLFRFCVGLGKKVLLANYAGKVASGLLDGGAVSMADAWLGVVLFSFQIYFDFSGYSDMAIGLGRIFGFTYPENFNLPYISKSITEFWRRWHISLSTFFRDYVYIPLGGNRKHQWLNLLVVWFLTGLWHGASWNFIFWGLYYCLLLCIEKAIGEKRLKHVPGLLRRVFTLFFVALGWMIFYYTDLSALAVTAKAAFGMGRLSSAQSGILFMNNLPLLIACLICSTPLLRKVGQGFGWLCLMRKPSKGGQAAYALVRFAVMLALLAVATVSLVGESYNPFLYFRF